MGFLDRKEAILAAIDKSPKGSLDAPIVQLLKFLNEQQNVVTTSSCSGRLSLFCRTVGADKGGQWLYVTHEPTRSDADKVWDALQRCEGNCSFFFEPFLLHCEAATLEDGQKLLQVAQQVGFRESGLSVSARVMVMIRTTAYGIQVPLDRRLVPRAFVDFLVDDAHRRFACNSVRVMNLEFALREYYSTMPSTSNWVWVVPRAETKFWKTEAEKRNLIDKRRKVQPSDEGMAIPLLHPEHIEGDPLPVEFTQVAKPVAPQENLDLKRALQHRSVQKNSPEVAPVSKDHKSPSACSSNCTSPRCACASSTASNASLILPNTTPEHKLVPHEMHGRVLTPHETREQRSEGPHEMHGRVLTPHEIREQRSESPHEMHVLTPHEIREQRSEGHLAWIVALAETKRWKSYAENAKWIDKSRKLQAFDVDCAIPLNCEYTPLCGHPPVVRIELKKPRRKRTLSEKIAHLNGDVSTIPAKWEMKGGIALFPEGSFSGWPEKVWGCVREFLGCRAVGLKHPVEDDDYRSSCVELKFPVDADPWVVHEDNGVRYCFDVTKVMFSRGNIKEKLRLAQFNCQEEIILDCYAGIGYWAFPLLVHAKAKHVVCCEWSPHSIEGLNVGAKLNRVHEQISVVKGDNASAESDTALSNFSFDRAILGLLPSSEKSWPVACKHLRKDTMTHAHVHCNILDKDEPARTEYVLTQWRKLLGRRVELVHLERVKWYAPRVRHCVLDLQVYPA